ncbi:MAG TPA: FAD-binding oxidoreductase [Ktedonobacteraceae bacterium]|nr:FAD-binding oxidoreductase [Ktedonobacteraceae bacterium]
MTDAMPPEEMARRNFLKLCGLVALPGFLAACQTEISGQGSVTPGPSPTVKPSATKTPTLTNADWSALAKRMKGPLILPGSAQYATARQLFDPRFDGVKPAAIAYCATPTDVQVCLAFAHRFNVAVTARSGGHSYAGYSTTTGLVLDVTHMNTVALNSNKASATVGAGAKLIDVYTALASHGLVVPAGSCPTVGVAGLTQGGGVGVIGRKFGLTCDNLLSAQVVTADGRVLTCDSKQNPDLFWALRGGGGGNFGVVTSFTFQTHQVPTLSLFTLQWSWGSAADVVNAWQSWAPQAPDEVWSNCLLLAPANKNASPLVQVNGVYVGGLAPLNSLLLQLTKRIGAAPSSRFVWTDSILNTMLYEAGCYNKTVAECHLPTQNPQGQYQRSVGGAKSDYFTKALPRPAINVLVNAISKRHASTTLGEGGISLDASGGAINRVAANATAFVHRNDLFSAQYNASWNVSDARSIVDANHAWLNATWQAMRPYASGAAYQNYIDPDLKNWQQAYYGSNFSRLQQVKATYDPHNFFHFAQSIPPATGA